MDNSEIAAGLFNKYANEYAIKFMDVSLYHKSFNFFCESITKVKPDILELGCGPGNITKYLISKRPDLNILGSDLAENMIALAVQNNPSAKFIKMDCRKFISLNKKFDGIVCGFILPYLSKIEAIQLIEDAAFVLNKNGVLYLSTMEDDNANSGMRKGSKGDEIYMNYHQADYLSQTLNDNDFEIINLERVQYSENPNEITTDLLIVAKKRTAG